MPAREMRVEMFLRALLRRDFSKAKVHLEKLQKMAGNDEWGRGYARAVNGFLSAIQDNDPDSLIVQLINEHDREKAEKLMEHFESILKHEFRDDYEKGYYTAWVEFLKAYLSQKTLA
ncbi:hypothetical protein A3L09_03625 [Thermococcus profundus]|uniref:Uncharacterized protein n=1 Tax=Thermococcus profundus TaxID=49899 RepID=A0A2Z2MEQ4_THEPR|nr:hypothetical protein [Thermococcus profundus]ASJ02404.1 hypothetical protein A3L09_03625 [Thermococcus profundus]